jgi:hypothetical protein
MSKDEVVAGTVLNIVLKQQGLVDVPTGNARLTHIQGSVLLSPSGDRLRSLQRPGAWMPRP